MESVPHGDLGRGVAGFLHRARRCDYHLAAEKGESTTAFRLMVHSADVIWPALHIVFATGSDNPFSCFTSCHRGRRLPLGFGRKL